MQQKIRKSEKIIQVAHSACVLRIATHFVLLKESSAARGLQTKKDGL